MGVALSAAPEDYRFAQNFQRMSDEIVDLLMTHTSTIDGAHDLIFQTGEPVWLAVYGRRYPITRRLQPEELSIIIKKLFSASSQARLDSKNSVSRAPMIRYDDGRRVRNLRFRAHAISCDVFGGQGYRVALRTIPTDPPTVEELGIEQEIVQKLRDMDSGLALFTGATGMGKSTTLAALNRDLLERPDAHANLVTAEDPIEFLYSQLERPSSIVSQHEIDRHTSSPHAMVVDALRMNPTDIMIQEIRDLDMAEAALEAGNSGHRVRSTLHTNSVPTTLQRLVNLWPEDQRDMARFDLAESSQMIVTQRLVPTVDGKRAAAREVLILDPQIRDKLVRAERIDIAAHDLLQSYGQPMIEPMTRLYEEGRLSDDEFQRQKREYNYRTEVMERSR